jgi:hypothetical protein
MCAPYADKTYILNKMQVVWNHHWSDVIFVALELQWDQYQETSAKQLN